MRRLIICWVVLMACLAQADVFMYLNTARIAYFNDRDYDRARKACLEGLAQAPDNVELLLILGASEMGLGNWGAASQSFEKAFGADTAKALDWITRRPEGVKYYFQAFYFHGRDLFERAEYEQTLRYLGYDAVFGIDDINVRVLRGATLHRLGRFEEANEEYLQVLRIHPQNPDVSYLIAKSLFDNEDYAGCLPYLTTAITQYTSRYQRLGRVVFQNRGAIDSLLAQQIVVLWKEGDRDGLDRMLRDSLGFDQGLTVQESNIAQFAKTSEDLGRSYYCCAMAHHGLKDDTLALENMLLSVRYNPDDIDGLYYAGEMSVKLGRYADAVPYLERLTTLYPEDKYGWFYLGVCYTETKQYQKAVDVYENRFLKIDPENVDVMNNLAYVYREMGENEKALRWLIRAGEMKKDSP